MLTEHLLDEESLDMICGGDKGDAKWDSNSKKSMYDIGQCVPVYTDVLHLFKTNTIIVDMAFNEDKGHWMYKCEFSSFIDSKSMKGEKMIQIATKWVDASYIKRQ